MLKSEIVMVKVPQDPNYTCQLSHYTTQVHERRDGKILIDYPLGLNYRERRWIVENDLVIKIG